MRRYVIFSVIFAIAHPVTYFLAGFLARAMGVDAFYPPAPTALSYLKSMEAVGQEIGLVLLAQVLRGLLFAAVLFPFAGVLRAMSVWKSGLALGAVLFVVGYVAASGGMIEHFVFFSEYPAGFVAITVVEVFLQTFALGLLVSWLDRRFIGQG